MPLNPWLAAKLALIPNSWPEDVSLSLIVETAPGLEQLVQTQLGEIAGVRVGRRARNYIEAVVPLPFIRRVSNLTGVFMVHYNMPQRIMQLEPPLRPSLSLPFLDQLVTRFDPLMGYMKIDDVVVPRKRIGPDMLLPFSPMRFLAHHGPLGEFEFIPTIRSRDVLLDVPTAYTGRGVTVAVLDTGWNPLISIYRGKALSTCSTDPQPLDGHGHGTWCASAAVGSRDVGPLGTCLGVAPEANLVAIKVLNGVFGFGSTMDIIAGIARAVAEGARVISMSLGGSECQGGCLLCPSCTTVRAYSREGVFFTIAAGNSGDKGGWTIGCPGCSPEGISVGSVSLTDYPQPAYFSSRGPQNPANADIMEMDEFNRKPDALSVGGGRALVGSKPDELIYSGEVGWMRGIYSGLPDPHDGMHGCVLAGTRISTPDGFKLAEELKPGDLLYSFNGHGLSIGTVLKRWDEGVQPVWEVQGRNKKIVVTGNHPLLVMRRTRVGVRRWAYRMEWCPAERLARDEDCAVVTVNALPYAPTKKIGEGLARWLGYFLGDGWLTSQPYALALAKDVREERNAYYLDLTVKLFGVNLRSASSYYRCSDKRLYSYLQGLGLKKLSPEKEVPNLVFSLPPEEIEAFFKGYMDADGYRREIGDGKGDWRLECRSRRLIEGMAELGSRLGWKTSRVYSRTRRLQAPSAKSACDVQTWSLSVAPFRDGWFAGNMKRCRPENLFDVAFLGLQHVKQVRQVGTERVVDLTVDGFHNFVGDGLLCHNTSQATPAVAGLVACLLEGGRIATPDDFKAVCAQKGHAKTVEDGWGVVKLSWFL